MWIKVEITKTDIEVARLRREEHFSLGCNRDWSPAWYALSRIFQVPLAICGNVLYFWPWWDLGYENVKGREEYMYLPKGLSYWGCNTDKPTTISINLRQDKYKHLRDFQPRKAVYGVFTADEVIALDTPFGQPNPNPPTGTQPS